MAFGSEDPLDRPRIFESKSFCTWSKPGRLVGPVAYAPPSTKAFCAGNCWENCAAADFTDGITPNALANCSCWSVEVRYLPRSTAAAWFLLLAAIPQQFVNDSVACCEPAGSGTTVYF